MNNNLLKSKSHEREVLKRLMNKYLRNGNKITRIPCKDLPPKANKCRAYESY